MIAPQNSPSQTENNLKNKIFVYESFVIVYIKLTGSELNKWHYVVLYWGLYAHKHVSHPQPYLQYLFLYCVLICYKIRPTTAMEHTTTAGRQNSKQMHLINFKLFHYKE